MALHMHMVTRAFFSPRTAFLSRAAQMGTKTSTKMMESKMSFCIDGDPLRTTQAPGRGLRKATRPRKSRLSVLFVTPFLPSPPTFGAQRRLHELISGVAVADDASLLSLVDPGENQDEGTRACEEYCRRVVTVSNPAYHTGGSRKRLMQ